MVLKVKIKGLKRIQKKLRGLEKKVYRPAMVSAINKTMTSARAQGARDIAKSMGGPRIGDVKRDMKQHKATKNRLQAVIISRGSPLSLTSFKARGLKKRGVSHTAYGSGRKVIKGAFLATGRRSGVESAFVRTSKKRYPIKKLWGPGIARTMATQEVMDGMFKVIDQKFYPTLQQQINFRMSKLR